MGKLEYVDQSLELVSVRMRMTLVERKLMKEGIRTNGTIKIKHMCTPIPHPDNYGRYNNLDLTS